MIYRIRDNIDILIKESQTDKISKDITCLCVCVCVCVCVTYNKGVGSGFRDVYNSYRIMTK